MSWSGRPDDPLPPDHPERDRRRSNGQARVFAGTRMLIGSVIALAGLRRCRSAPRWRRSNGSSLS